jgi:predicted RecB family nuclease
MLISSPLFQAYLECSTKCWLRSRAEPSAGNAYAEWVRLQDQTYYENGLKRLLALYPEDHRAIAPSISKQAKNATWRIAIDTCLRVQAVERTHPEGRGSLTQFVPYCFRFANKLSKNDKMSLAFDAVVLAETIGCEVSIGKIMHGDSNHTLKVNLSSLASEVQNRIPKVSALLADDSPPDLVLNRHCSQCEFQARCRKQATEKDDLSLLSGMSDKDRRKLHDKGIFTITQLSYTFRPRRRNRKLRDKKEKFHHSLRALAIREKKIHAVDLPNQMLDGVPVYLDVEGLPDRDFYYLIGARIGTGDRAIQHTFWANDANDEKGMWSEFLGLLSSIPQPQIIHYGSYETGFFKQMFNRYGEPQQNCPPAEAIKSAVNLLSTIFARIYFPTFSNGLKDIAGYLRFRWFGSPLSGLEAIVCRNQWEASRDAAGKQALIDYNRQDCEALELVARRLIDLQRAGPQNEEVVCTSKMRGENPYRFGRIAFAIPAMETINKAAYWDYQRERVYVKSRKDSLSCKTPGTKRHRKPKPNITIDYQAALCCPTCKSTKIYSHGTRSKIIIDLRFMKHGMKRWIVRYMIHRQRCQSCGSIFKPSDLRWTPAKYGRNLIAYAMYQNIELYQPQMSIDTNMSRLFGLRLPRGWTSRMKMAAAQSYAVTYDRLVKKLCSGQLLHVDETSVSVRGINGYVWALASMEEVAYFFTPSREGNTIQELLKNFSGVLVSDFYAAYDAIKCPQQKCLIHFIRDLNSAILDHPYDEALKQLAGSFTELVKPIIETVERRGLKRRFLKKFRISVDQFYSQIAEHSSGEAAGGLIERLNRNRNEMFTFLEFDNVPWNNNDAEHAIKAFALLRRVIEGISTEKGLQDSLVLLSICQTCKCKNIDFLDFLRSGSTNIDESIVNGRRPRLQGASGLIHSVDSQIGRNSSSSRYESRNFRQHHASRSPPPCLPSPHPASRS